MRTIDELIWAIQTFTEENPQVGVVGDKIDRLFQGVESGQLVNNHEIKFKKLLLKFQEKGKSESVPEIDFSVSKIDLTPDHENHTFLFEDSFDIQKLDANSPELLEINKRR